ncbi:MAG: hypothetical protein JOZ82_09305 [Marmoricola sp.]|nr:hypothetical protein [Marmoricola sp.]
MRSFARLGAAVAATTLAVTGLDIGLGLAAPAAQATPAKDPIGVDTGASWLVKQLTHGIVHNNQYSFDDYGLTIDVALGLDAVGGHASDVSSIVNALEPGAYDNYTTSTFNNVTTTYAGQVAKLMVLVQRAGGTPTSYGGHDLKTQLEGTVASGAPIAGRIQDQNNGFGDANVLGQAYAARALADASSGKASSVLSFLLEQQCPNGGFRLTFNSDKTAAGQSCTDNSQAQIDATSVALIEMRGLSGTSTAVADAESFLLGKQHSDGAWGGDPGGSAENSNATGLAAWALGDTAASAKGAAWLRDHQATYYDYCTRLKNDVGAVAYDAAGLAAARSGGIDPTSAAQDQARRATAQALPGLKYLVVDPTPSAPRLTGPSSYEKAGSAITFRTDGVHAGDQLCLTTTGSSAGGTAAGTVWHRALTLPAGTATRTVTVRDRDGHSDTATVKVLGAKRLSVLRGSYRHKRKSVLTVTVAGLAPGEVASVYYKGRRVGIGHASSTGRFVDTFRVGRQKGRKVVHAYGQFAIRSGRAAIKVVK